MSGPIVFASVEAFYAADPRRARSGEVDYGVMWLDGLERWPCWRVSFVVDTGELYAVRLAGGEVVELLGRLGSREACEARLEGWADRCGEPDSLSWARRMAS